MEAEYFHEGGVGCNWQRLKYCMECNSDERVCMSE
jgi:hypothetical protein